LAGVGAEIPRLTSLRDRFEAELSRVTPEAVIFGVGTQRIANTSNFSIPNLAAETALIALDLDGVAVSSGSAGSSGKVKPSHVLAAMGVDQSLARCGIRVSFGWTSREEDVDLVISSLRRLIDRRAVLAA
jgi:cysteine desulfurase